MSECCECGARQGLAQTMCRVCRRIGWLCAGCRFTQSLMLGRVS